jgi:hypothetical protein
MGPSSFICSYLSRRELVYFSVQETTGAWADRVKNVVLQESKRQGISLMIKWWKGNWICHTLHRNRRIKHVTERMIEEMGGRGRRWK